MDFEAGGTTVLFLLPDACISVFLIFQAGALCCPVPVLKRVLYSLRG